ncbi:hypothetical protein [Rhodocyclus tenuis]|uniref:hypothetical protein n=1 Tax=Rhodocyclus tenuis TaxID=1066 RepID=UPI001903D732|nr:hypothetical protein [Rhodocyclus tenuis]
MEDAVIKEYLRRMVIYFLGFSFSFLCFAVLFPPVINVISWASSKRWKSWGEMLDDGVFIIYRGIIVSLAIAFILALVDYGKFRGWNDTRTGTLIVLVVATLVGVAEYVRRHG